MEVMVGGAGVNVAVGGISVGVGEGGTCVWVGKGVAVGSGVLVAVGMAGGNVGMEVAVVVGETGGSEMHPASTIRAHRHEIFSRLILFGLSKGWYPIFGWLV